MTWGCLNFNKTWICECTVPLNSTAYINKLILHKLFSLDDNCASDHESSISSEQICFVWRGLCACERQDHITQISLLALYSYSHSSCYCVNLLLLHPIDPGMSKRGPVIGYNSNRCDWSVSPGEGITGLCFNGSQISTHFSFIRVDFINGNFYLGLHLDWSC